MQDKILEKVIDFIKEIIEILQNQYKLLKQRGYGTQEFNDLKQEQFRLPSGVIVPSKSIEYYILFDHYELLVVQSLIRLQKNIFNKRDSPFIAFSLRTLLDIGINRINVLFADEITRCEKKHLKLLASLIDFVSTDDPLFKEYFIKLFEAEKSNLLQKERQLFQDILSLMKSKNDIELMERVIKARRKLSDVETKILAKIEPLAILNKANTRLFRSWQSHMLHGNPFLIQNVFEAHNKERGKLKAFAILMITGLNSINRLANYLNDPKISLEVKYKNREIETLWTAYINFSMQKLWGHKIS